MNESLFGFSSPAVAGIRYVVRKFVGGVFSGYLLEPPPSPEQNAAIVLRPRGTGAIQVAVSDGLVTGGNARGAYAVDLQSARTVASEVASGSYSVAAGRNSVASGDDSIALGKGNIASGSLSFSAGSTATASGTLSVALGPCWANGYAAVALGQSGQANGQYSTAIGHSPSARSVQGNFVAGSGTFSAVGDAQTSVMILRRQTTNATPAVLTSTGGSSSTTNIPVLANDATTAFHVIVVARRTDADNESAGYEITGVIDRNGSAATTALVGAPVVTVLAEDTAAWDVTATADTTNGGLNINVTGEAAKTINWVAVVRATEVVG